jgi:hypothetical protein
MSYNVMKALTVNVGPGLVDCDNANSNLNEKLQGRGGDISYSAGGGRAAKIMNNCGCRARVERRS